MSWTRHLYDPVGAIGRDLLGGGPRRVMTPAEIAQARGGGGQSARDPSRVGGAYSSSRQQRPESSYERREPLMLAEQAMPKPAPLASPGNQPAAPSAAQRYPGQGGGGLAVIPSGSGGLQSGPADGGLAPGRPDRGPVGPLPGQPGSPYPARPDNGPLPGRFGGRPVMSVDPNAPAPTGGRFARRPFP